MGFRNTKTLHPCRCHLTLCNTFWYQLLSKSLCLSPVSYQLAKCQTSVQQAVSWSPLAPLNLQFLCVCCVHTMSVSLPVCVFDRDSNIHCFTLQSVEQAVSWPTHNPTSASQLAATTWRQTLVCWHWAGQALLRRRNWLLTMPPKLRWAASC